MTTNPLEFLLLGAVLLACLLRYLPHRRFGRLFYATAMLAVIVVVVDVALGNLRWQTIGGRAAGGLP